METNTKLLILIATIVSLPITVPLMGIAGFTLIVMVASIVGMMFSDPILGISMFVAFAVFIGVTIYLLKKAITFIFKNKPSQEE